MDTAAETLDTSATRQPPASSGVPKRVRINREIDPALRAWLRRVSQSHAHLCYVIRLYATPEIAGGQSLEGEAFAARAERGDPTLLFDVLTLVGDEIAELRADVLRRMNSAPTTTARPGTAEKVQAMLERAAAGFSIFIDGDAR